MQKQQRQGEDEINILSHLFIYPLIGYSRTPLLTFRCIFAKPKNEKNKNEKQIQLNTYTEFDFVIISLCLKDHLRKTVVA